MKRWLFKEEPTHYSYDDLERDGEATWDGVANALARKHLSAIQPGDVVFLYHTGKEKAIVGILEVVSAPDPVRVRPVKRLARNVPLVWIKAQPSLADWELVRLPRLSVLPVTETQWASIEDHAKGGE